ncbi:MAG: EamA family transporter, partial [Thermoplasmatota archaeon]
MIWIVFAFLTAFFESIKDVLSKKSLKEIDEYVVAWSLWFFSIPFLVLVLFIVGIPKIDSSFWLFLFLGGVCNVFATIFYMKSIKLADLSISVPLLAFSPLFLLFTSPLLVGEFPNQYGLIGVLLIVLGSYMLNIKKRSKGIIEPFRALIKEKGPRFMLLVAVIWSISANIDKIGVKNSTPFFWITMMAVFVSLSLFPIVIFRFPKNRKKTKNWITTLFPIGLIYGLTILNQMIAINLTLVSYVISIKRTSTILVVIWGYLIFKEKNIKNRIAGAVIM